MGERIINPIHNSFKQYKKMNLVNPYLFANIQLNTGLSAYYKFDSNSNASFGGINGTPVFITYTGGKIGNCAVFNNFTARIDLADSDIFSFTSGVGVDLPFSFSLWVYVTAFSSVSNFLINKRGDSTNTEWQMSLTPTGQISFTKFSGGGNTVFQTVRTPSSSISINTWTHIVFTSDGSKIALNDKIYVNGVNMSLTNASSGTYTGMVNGNSITRIGLNAWDLLNPNLRHQGYIDELGIWKNKTLNSGEVTTLYNYGSGRSYPF